MIKFSIYRDELEDNKGNPYPIFDIETYNKVNLVIGKSGTGKTYLCNIITSILSGNTDIWSYECYDIRTGNSIEVRIANTVSALESIVKTTTGALIILDESLTNTLRKSGKLDSTIKSQNYFLIMDRQILIKMDINVKAVFIFEKYKYKNKHAYRTKNVIELKSTKVSDNSSNITHMITEDTTSGKLFWKNILDKLYLLEYKDYGNGSMPKNIEKALKQISGTLLVILEYDMGAIQLQQICRNNKIDKSRIRFMSLESFEEVVCNSEFIISKYGDSIGELVKNYKMYINYSSKSTGKYFSYLLFAYVKTNRHMDSEAKRNKTKFYEKGMQYFKECFIDNCCGLGNECNMKYVGDKKKAMLNNKFQEYQVFINN